MRPESFSLIVQSIEQPGGLMEIYKGHEIGDDPDCTIPLLETCKGFFMELQCEKEPGITPGNYRYRNINHGLAFKYGIHHAFSENIRLQLILTRERTEYPIVHGKEGHIHTFHIIEMLGEIQRFAYAPGEIQRVGESIKAGQIAGPLENAVLQEALEKDRNAGERRQTVGNYLTALGEFAEGLLQRELSID